MKAYCCQPQVVSKNGQWETSIGIPTFYLFRSVQGIVDKEHAERIVRSICNPTQNPAIIVYPNVNLVDVVQEFEA